MTSTPNIANSFTIVYFPEGGKRVDFEALISPTDRAEAVREAFALWQGNPRDCYLSGNGAFDYGHERPLLLPGCHWAGLGRESTINYGSVISDDVGTNFQLGDGSVVEEMGFIQDSINKGQDGRCLGFDNPGSAIVRRVSVWGREWALYNWQPGTSLLFEDGDITAGRVCIAAENSGIGQTFTIRNTDVLGDASLSQCTSDNAVSDPETGGIFGLIARGGLTTLDNVRMTIRGIGQPPRACAITDHGGKGDGPAGNARLVLRNFQCNVSSPNPNWYDLDLSAVWMQTTLVDDWCRGSESDGSLKRSW
jgi:hypothetical protein